VAFGKRPEFIRPRRCNVEVERATAKKPGRVGFEERKKCDEPYTREEVLEECFADLFKGLVFDDQVMDWIVDALHQSHADEKRSSEKRKLLNFVCSNSIWKDQTLTATFRQPFDLLAITNTTWQRKKAAGATSSDLRPIWLRR